MRGLRLFLAACLLTLGYAAQAADFQLPGLERDANAYANSLTARSPAGGTPTARQAAEQKAAEAEKNAPRVEPPTDGQKPGLKSHDKTSFHDQRGFGGPNTKGFQRASAVRKVGGGG